MSEELSPLQQMPNALTELVKLWNAASIEIDDLIIKLEGHEDRAIAASATANSLTAQINELTVSNDSLRRAADKGVEIAKSAMTLKSKFDRTEANLSVCQEENRALKQHGDPKKLKEKVKELQEANSDKQKTIDLLRRELNRDSHKWGTKLKLAESQISALADELKAQECSNMVNVYHDGNHNLLTFPTELTISMGKQEGEPFVGTPLLYMDARGNGRLVVLDENGEAVGAKSAPGGIKPSKEVFVAAKLWLTKVNKKQKGVILLEDLAPLN